MNEDETKLLTISIIYEAFPLAQRLLFNWGAAGSFHRGINFHYWLFRDSFELRDEKLIWIVNQTVEHVIVQFRNRSLFALNFHRDTNHQSLNLICLSSLKLEETTTTAIFIKSAVMIAHELIDEMTRKREGSASSSCHWRCCVSSFKKL